MDQQSNSPSTCLVCGGNLPAGRACERCAQRSVLRLVRREIALLTFLSFLAVVVYMGTRSLEASNRRVRENVAARWFKEGQRDLQTGHASEAVAAFRKSAVNDRTSRVYLLSLAKALEASDRDTEAQELLLQVRENIPENPGINVELARIAAREKNVSEALRYYHNALYGVWTGDDVDTQRQAVRRELIEFLFTQNAKEQALAETVALAAHVPDTPAARLELGDLFLREKDATSALQNYRETLHHDPRNQMALRGAGEAAFHLGDYSSARRMLAALIQPDIKANDMLETARLVLENDPLEPHLTEAQRLDRARKDMESVSRRVDQCLAQPANATALQPLRSLQSKLAVQAQALQSAQKHPVPNVVFSSLELIYNAENAVSTACGPLSAQDTALLLVAQKNRGAEP
jgi:tetratricopeptide (TPR) repeat protein